MAAARMNERRRLPRLQYRMRKPVRLDETLANPAAICRLLLFQMVADVRQHLLEGLLFAGTETGVYCSLNDGRSWMRMGGACRSCRFTI